MFNNNINVSVEWKFGKSLKLHEFFNVLLSLNNYL